MSRQIIVRVPHSNVRTETQTEDVWVEGMDPNNCDGWFEERDIPYHYIVGVDTPAMCVVDMGKDWMELMFSANHWSSDWQQNAAVLQQYPHRYC